MIVYKKYTQSLTVMRAVMTWLHVSSIPVKLSSLISTRCHFFFKDWELTSYNSLLSYRDTVVALFGL